MLNVIPLTPNQNQTNQNQPIQFFNFIASWTKYVIVRQRFISLVKRCYFYESTNFPNDVNYPTLSTDWRDRLHLAPRNSQLLTSNSQLATRNLQLAARNSQLHNSQNTQSLCKKAKKSIKIKHKHDQRALREY